MRILMTSIMGLGSTYKYKLQKQYLGFIWITVKEIPAKEIIKYKDLPLVSKTMII